MASVGEVPFPGNTSTLLLRTLFPDIHLVVRSTVMGQRRKISGSLILITGASQGIGKALAEAAARRGGKVLAAARSDELLRQMSDHVRSQGGILETVHADVTCPEGRQRMVEAALHAFGGLDILINNAGIGA